MLHFTARGANCAESPLVLLYSKEFTAISNRIRSLYVTGQECLAKPRQQHAVRVPYTTLEAINHSNRPSMRARVSQEMGAFVGHATRKSVMAEPTLPTSSCTGSCDGRASEHMCHIQCTTQLGWLMPAAFGWKLHEPGGTCPAWGWAAHC